MRKDIIVYLNLYEVSSLQIQEKSKTPATYEMELFVTLATAAHHKLTSHQGLPKYHRGPRYASEVIFLKMSKADLKFLKTKRKTFTRNAKVKTCCKTILYTLNFRISPINSFD